MKIKLGKKAVDSANMLIAIAGIIIGAVITLTTVAWSNWNSRQIAIESGAFRKPNLHVYCFGKELASGDNNDRWVFIHPGQGGENGNISVDVSNRKQWRCCL
jgi:hypothetical protein